MIDDELRQHGPPGLTDEERSELRLDLLATIRSDASPSMTRRAGRTRWGKRRTVALVAATAVLLTGTAAAAFVGLTRPDPQQVDEILENAEPLAGSHLDGWRPELNAELARCVGPVGATDFEAYASSGPLDGTLRAVDLVDACAAKAATLDQRVGGDAPAICRTGTADAPTFASPTVLIDSTSDCASQGLEDYTADDVAELNEARAVEVALRAIDDPCPSRREALAWARTQADRIDTNLTLIDFETAGAPPEVCFGTYVNWVAGTAYIDAISTTN